MCPGGPAAYGSRLGVRPGMLVPNAHCCAVTPARRTPWCPPAGLACQSRPAGLFRVEALDPGGRLPGDTLGRQPRRAARPAEFSKSWLPSCGSSPKLLGFLRPARSSSPHRGPVPDAAESQSPASRGPTAGLWGESHPEPPLGMGRACPRPNPSANPVGGHGRTESHRMARPRVLVMPAIDRSPGRRTPCLRT
jgi:hypothetical protein